ncbi:gephyrin-like molybdotransferase Glp [Pseudothioclava nitratireducens]|uniref:molybdopterin molybdotransferase MoeA n=1 Tax=Pseudothioclava nitratireducens TaxID=1928646 RepID=UPI0023D9BA06|nr:gephyrin-like molybdotransferase Glp [Defluviimonas nitratireducens]MDF1619377.1 molybdopterin molybdotransferase MoeA [Defluviimonas nitratireducens]
MIPVQDALEKVLALVAPLEAETVALRDALGRVMAAPAIAGLNQPPFSASAMDGYWLAEADHQPGARLKVVEGEAAAGRSFGGTLARGQAVRIFTGAPVPADTGVVVLQENVTRSGDTITLPETLESNHNIRPLGQDFTKGESFHPKRRLSARDLGLLAAMNVPEVAVHRRPVVAIIATGDELVMPGESPGPDQILCSNNFLIGAMAEAAGAEVRMLPIARDDAESLRTVFALAQGADLVVTSGGASVGEHDLVGTVAAELGLERAFWKIAMRPGKPLMAGRLGDAAMLGLPGNPVSATVCGHLFLLPMLERMQGLEAGHRLQQAVLTDPVGPTGPRTHYMRAKLTPQDGALPAITAFSNQDSALLGVLSEADALLVRPLGDGPRAAGDIVGYLPL